MSSAQETRRLWRGQSHKHEVIEPLGTTWHPEGALCSFHVTSSRADLPHLLPHAVLDLLVLPGIICVLTPQPAQGAQSLFLLALGEQEPGRVGHEAEQEDHGKHGHLPSHGQPAPVQDQPCQSSTVRGKTLRNGCPGLASSWAPQGFHLLNPAGNTVIIKRNILNVFSPIKAAFPAV